MWTPSCTGRAAYRCRAPSSSTSRSSRSGENGFVRKRSAPAATARSWRGLVGHRGEHHDRRVRRRGIRAQPPAGLDPVQARHVVVEEDDLRLLLAAPPRSPACRRPPPRADSPRRPRSVVVISLRITGSSSTIRIVRVTRSPRGCARTPRRARCRRRRRSPGRTGVPAAPRIIWRASGQPTAGRYGRSVVSASSASATANTRAWTGIASPASAVRVAAAVPALVVVADDDLGVVEEVDVAEDLGADLRDACSSARAPPASAGRA